MKGRHLVLMIALSLSPLLGQELFTEIRARVSGDGEPYIFRLLGDPEEGAFSVYGIHVVAPDGREQMLDQFDAFLPAGSETDALYVEDVNFDGYADLRVMKYLPGGANVPYFFWIHDPATGSFREAPAYEVVLSPEVDRASGLLLSRQRLSAREFVTEYYRPSGEIPVLVRREERTFAPDGSSVLKLYEVDDTGPQLVETKNLPPEG